MGLIIAALGFWKIEYNSRERYSPEGMNSGCYMLMGGLSIFAIEFVFWCGFGLTRLF